METMIKSEIREITFPGKTFVTKRATIAFDNLTSFFSESYGEIYGLIQRMGIKSIEPPCAIYYSINESTMATDLAAAVPITEDHPEITPFDVVSIPERKAISATHFGSYDEIGKTYGFMEKYLADHNLKRELIIEEYLTDPSVETDPAKWMTNIYFLLAE